MGMDRTGSYSYGICLWRHRYIAFGFGALLQLHRDMALPQGSLEHPFIGKLVAQGTGAGGHFLVQRSDDARVSPREQAVKIPDFGV